MCVNFQSQVRSTSPKQCNRFFPAALPASFMTLQLNIGGESTIPRSVTASLSCNCRNCSNSRLLLFWRRSENILKIDLTKGFPKCNMKMMLFSQLHAVEGYALSRCRRSITKNWLDKRKNRLAFSTCMSRRKNDEYKTRSTKGHDLSF